MKQLEKQIKLNLVTGEVVEVNVQPNISVANYFYSLNILNKSAPLYGCVYLATDEALDVLRVGTQGDE